MRKILIYNLIPILLMSFLMTNVALAISPPPPCDEYTIDEKEVLDDVLNSPQMAPLSDWELAEHQFDSCASYGIFKLGLKYILPENFSNLGFRYISKFSLISLSIDTGKAKDGGLNTYNRLATVAKSAIQSAENNNRIKEFINKVGAEKYIFGSHIWFRNESIKTHIEYSYENQRVYRYTVPVDIAWGNFPEVSHFQSIFRKEIPSENCSLDFQNGTISSGQYDEKGKMLWRFNQTVKGTACPAWIRVDIYEDGTYKASIDPTVLIPWSGSSKNKIIVNQESEDLYSVELIIQDYELGEYNVPRIFDVSLIEDGTEYYITDTNKDGDFGSIKRDYTKESGIEGIHMNVSGEDCEPRRQNIGLSLMTKEERLYTISDLSIESIESIENIWIDTVSEPVCPIGAGCPNWISDPDYCKDYETFSEKPEEKITVRNSCGKGPDYCYGTIEMSPFLYSPIDKRLRIIKRMKFNVNISTEEMPTDEEVIEEVPAKIEIPQEEETKKIKSSTEVSTMLISQKELESIQDIQLKHSAKKSTYEVMGVQKAKFLFFIPVSFKIRMEINAFTGEIEAVKKPWWSFLVW